MGLNEKFFKSADEDGPFFNTVLHSGNSTGTTRQITGVGFQPDLVITKAINATQINSVYDSVRGVGNGVDSAGERQLATSLTNGQSDFDGRVNGYLSSFDLDGFTATKGTGAGRYYYNRSGYNYVNWCFKAGGAAVSNTDGDVQSNVSANVANGFSIVKYSGGNSSGTTVGHGLSSAPELIITKNTSKNSSWPVFVTGGIAMGSSTFTLEGSSQYLALNSTTSFISYSFDSQFGGTANSGSSSQNIISYCFHSVAGVSKVGSYVGTGVTGNKQTIGFEPSWIMIKRTSTTGGWTIVDNKRTPLNKYLSANSNAVETSATSPIVFESDGFSFGGTGVSFNQSGQTAIYYAIA